MVLDGMGGILGTATLMLCMIINNMTWLISSEFFIFQSGDRADLGEASRYVRGARSPAMACCTEDATALQSTPSVRSLTCAVDALSKTQRMEVLDDSRTHMLFKG